MAGLKELTLIGIFNEEANIVPAIDILPSEPDRVIPVPTFTMEVDPLMVIVDDPDPTVAIPAAEKFLLSSIAFISLICIDIVLT